MGKRQAFIDLYRSGNASRQDYINLANSFKAKSLDVPIDPLKQLLIHEMMMSGALPSELKHGGIAGLTPRRGRVTHPGGYAGDNLSKARDVWESVYGTEPDGTIVYVKDLYSGDFDEFLEIFRMHYHAKGGRVSEEKAKGGLARILNLS